MEQYFSNRRAVAWTAAALIAVTLILNAVGFFVLPDTLAIQLAAGGGAGNTALRAVYLPLGAVLVAAACVWFWRSAPETRPRALIAAGLLFLANAAVFVVNLLGLVTA